MRAGFPDRLEYAPTLGDACPTINRFFAALFTILVRVPRIPAQTRDFPGVAAVPKTAASCAFAALAPRAQLARTPSQIQPHRLHGSPRYIPTVASRAIGRSATLRGHASGCRHNGLAKNVSGVPNVQRRNGATRR